MQILRLIYLADFVIFRCLETASSYGLLFLGVRRTNQLFERGQYKFYCFSEDVCFCSQRKCTVSQHTESYWYANFVRAFCCLTRIFAQFCSHLQQTLFTIAALKSQTVLFSMCQVTCIQCTWVHVLKTTKKKHASQHHLALAFQIVSFSKEFVLFSVTRPMCHWFSI